jgi:hypothetical protein
MNLDKQAEDVMELIDKHIEQERLEKRNKVKENEREYRKKYNKEIRTKILDKLYDVNVVSINCYDQFGKRRRIQINARLIKFVNTSQSKDDSFFVISNHSEFMNIDDSMPIECIATSTSNSKDDALLTKSDIESFNKNGLSFLLAIKKTSDDKEVKVC